MSCCCDFNGRNSSRIDLILIQGEIKLFTLVPYKTFPLPPNYYFNQTKVVFFYFYSTVMAENVAGTQLQTLYFYCYIWLWLKLVAHVLLSSWKCCMIILHLGCTRLAHLFLQGTELFGLLYRSHRAYKNIWNTTHRFLNAHSRCLCSGLPAFLQSGSWVTQKTQMHLSFF